MDFVGQRRECNVERNTVPDGSAVDVFRSRHAPVSNHFVKKRRSDTNITCRLNAREASWRVRDRVTLHRRRPKNVGARVGWLLQVGVLRNGTVMLPEQINFMQMPLNGEGVMEYSGNIALSGTPLNRPFGKRRLWSANRMNARQEFGGAMPCGSKQITVADRRLAIDV